MEISRRYFVHGCAIASITGCGLPSGADSTRYVNAFRFPQENRYGLAVFDSNGNIYYEMELPERGHGFAKHPIKNEFAAISRRPGTYLTIIDGNNGSIKHVINSEQGFHYYGHATYAASGKMLFTTENAYESGDGVIGVYETATYSRLGSFNAGGIGPHEIVLMPDKRTLAIAIGGIQTHPSARRQKLNIATMEAAICFVDSQTGRLLRKWPLPDPRWSKLSIRHLAANRYRPDEVAVAMQWEGDHTILPPLIGLCHIKKGWHLLRAPEHIQQAMRLYCGAVAFSDNGQQFIVSSPRGNILTVWSKDGQIINSHTAYDGCGVAPSTVDKAGFLASTGSGVIQPIGQPAAQPYQSKKNWDNHLTRL